jgi:hypothetical protein
VSISPFMKAVSTTHISPMVYEFEKFEFEKYPPAEAITFGVLS